jgi:hypothetical protein
VTATHVRGRRLALPRRADSAPAAPGLSYRPAPEA